MSDAGCVPPRMPPDGKIARPAMVELRRRFSPRVSWRIEVASAAMGSAARAKRALNSMVAVDRCAGSDELTLI